MTEPSLTQQVIDRCRDALFTGIARVRTRQAAGEIWFLSGILERVRFGVSTGNEAMNRMLAAADPRIDVVACLPNPAGGFDKGHPMEGELGITLPVDLLRFCEMHALTCTVQFLAGDSGGEATYRLGELLSIRSDAGSDQAVAKMLEWSEGRYRFILPSVDLPKNAGGALASMPPAEPAEEPMRAEPEAWRTAANEALKRKVIEGEAKRKAEEKRQIEEIPVAEPAHPAEEVREAVEAPVFSVTVSLQRVTTECVHISVPVTSAMMKSEPESDGSYRVSTEALFAEAERLARQPNVAWQPEGEPRVSIHPKQTPPVDPRSS